MFTLCLALVISRIPPSLKMSQTASESAVYLRDDLRFAPDIGVQELVCFNWIGLSSRRPLCFSSRPSFLSLCLVLLSGDIEQIPGPGPCHPCGSCSRAVRANQRGIFCEVCYSWFHTKCVDMSVDEYSRLGSSVEGWCCPNCFREALPCFVSSALQSLDDLAGHVPDSTLPLAPPSHPDIESNLSHPQLIVEAFYLT